MRKKLIVLLSTICLFSCNNASSNDSNFIIDNDDLPFTYLVVNDAIRIVEIKSTEKDKELDLVIPQYIDSLPVEKINDNAFAESNIKSLTFEEGSFVDEIGKYAFSDCKNLESINLPKSLLSIDEGAFYQCESLVDVDFSNASKLEVISTASFYNAISLKNITLSQNLKIIGDECFYSCNSLEEVIIPSKIELIDYMAFSNIATNALIKFTGIDEIPSTFNDEWNFSINDEGEESYINYIFE